MAFIVEDVKGQEFTSFKDIEDYAKEEKDKIKYVPIVDFLDCKPIFTDDEFWGRGKSVYSFNEDGFSAFCEKAGIPMNFIQELTEQGLASKVLNDRINNHVTINRLSKSKFVTDSFTKTIIGIVGNSYQSYYNLDLLSDLGRDLPDIYKKYEMTRSYVINTNLFLRVLSPKIKSELIMDTEEIFEDISKIGLQISNSLVGDRSVNFKFYVLRLACSNGLVIESVNRQSRVPHRGKSEAFKKKLKETINPIVGDLKKIPKMLEALIEIEYNPEALAEIGGADEIYKIIPLDDKTNEQRKRHKGDKKKLTEFDVKIISGYPQKYAGPYSGRIFRYNYRYNYSMFDFVNIFTEYAHLDEISLRKRVEVEQRTGDFVNWVIKNKNSLEKQIKIINSRYEQLGFWN